MGVPETFINQEIFSMEIAEIEYQAIECTHPRRIVAISHKIEDRPMATGKQLSLFEEDEIIGQYRFSTLQRIFPGQPG